MEGKLFLIVECQIINSKGIMKLENHEQMPMPTRVVKSLMTDSIFIYSQNITPNCLLNKGKPRSFTVKKLGRQ